VGILTAASAAIAGQVASLPVIRVLELRRLLRALRAAWRQRGDPGFAFGYVRTRLPRAERVLQGMLRIVAAVLYHAWLG